MYISKADIENFLEKTISNTYNSWVTTVIGAVEEYIDHYCGTDFENATSGDRYYDGNGGSVLNIEPVQTITAVYFLDINGNVQSTLGAGDYTLFPYNETSKTQIRLTGASYADFPNRMRSVKVTGTFGSATPPAPVKLAGIQICARIIKEGLAGGQVSSETLGSYSVSYKQIDESLDAMGAKEILNQYRVMTLD